MNVALSPLAFAIADRARTILVRLFCTNAPHKDYKLKFNKKYCICAMKMSPQNLRHFLTILLLMTEPPEQKYYNEPCSFAMAYYLHPFGFFVKLQSIPSYRSSKSQTTGKKFLSN